jgi:hypothetical protein
MSNLGVVSQVGFLGTNQYPNRISTNNWVVLFKPGDLPRDINYEAWHGSLLGPGGYALIYLNNDLYGVAENGRYNEFSPNSSAMYITKGSEVSIHWSIATGAAPKVWFYLRTPEVGILS